MDFSEDSLPDKNLKYEGCFQQLEPSNLFFLRQGFINFTFTKKVFDSFSSFGKNKTPKEDFAEEEDAKQDTQGMENGYVTEAGAACAEEKTDYRSHKNKRSKTANLEEEREEKENN
ncbi:hypothetical protein DAPPUDRAFT_116175 [Daphnia pulex]|uniref:Uncharacterized protein n=1 Tax=Daphnia pulex TaxID=6669 RepID=E9HNU1_DAPPU|nr:hypothetical protein DAPPUDRAFT_116175 [Daphnia pulex]|eukprot:EFX66560.1 hypothetical protein DAPPUDRAFT_116175 [Daphnia pulex]